MIKNKVDMIVGQHLEGVQTDEDVAALNAGAIGWTVRPHVRHVETAAERGLLWVTASAPTGRKRRPSLCQIRSLDALAACSIAAPWPVSRGSSAVFSMLP